MPHSDDPRLRSEARHHDRARAAIDAMRSATLDAVDTFQADYLEGKKNRYADDAGPDHSLAFSIAQYRDTRLEDLAHRDVPLFFARLWLDSGEDYHLGRRHVRDEDDPSTALVIDWRAPIAERFYRASAHHRLEVLRRRRFGFQGTTLTSLEDEDLRRGQEVHSDLLAAEIERPRTGPMRDIVATIQPEQDELIRRGPDASLCIQGAPGTGKTAVGLHRAAWLLYTYPRHFRAHPMLVVGPNDGFLRYISAVLPALGEASVRQTTVDDLTGAGSAPGSDSLQTALIKHDARMATVCQRAVWSHVGQLHDPVVITHAGTRWTFEPDDVSRAIDRTRATSRTWNSARKTLEHTLLHQVLLQHEQRYHRTPDSRFTAEIRRHPSFKQTLDQVWPRLTAKQVLRKLYTDDDFRARACADLLTDDEAELLRRSGGVFRFSPADALVLEELQAHLVPRDTDQTYGHVVVDEAQDLSPMQCRAFARRCRTGALTVLGDLAQGTTAWAARDWPTQMHHLDRPDAERTELTTGFRVPATVLELANRILPHLGVPVSPTRSVRTDGTTDVVHTDDLVREVHATVLAALDEEGLVGVIATAADLALLRPVLPSHDRVELVQADLAKGLEYDHVVVIEPAAVVAAPATGGHSRPGVGLRHLYVALTRAVSRLTILHERPLPPEILEPQPNEQPFSRVQDLATTHPVHETLSV
ncbi:AAA family ATPase (plasmid) [Cellulosimicrobium cellulans]|nr:AAA family ATPase [Cellulosimicrobium cellulans]